MKSFALFAFCGSVNAQDDGYGNFTQSLRSLLSPRDGLSLTGAPKLSGKYCGWSQHGEDIHCRVTFSGGKAHVEFKKKGGHSSSKCKDGKSPDDHDCCLCGKDRNINCDESYKVSEGGKLYSGLGVDMFSSGYDVHFNDNSCLKSAMGEDKKNPNGVPLRIKIHDETHLDLIECKQQEDSFCDGGGISCDMMSEHSSARPDGCDGWDNHHAPSCRRRAGCHPGDSRRRGADESRRRRGGDDRRRRSSDDSRRRGGDASHRRRRAGLDEEGPDEDFDDDYDDLDDTDEVV